MKKTERIIDHLDLEEVWNNPEKPWSFWAKKVGAHPGSVYDAMRREGWLRGDDGKLSEVPCRLCYKSTKVKWLNRKRVCQRCDHPNRKLYEEELRSYIERQPHMIAYIERSL